MKDKMKDEIKYRLMPVIEPRAIRAESGLITEVEGYAAVYGNVDSYGEIIDKGAFNLSVAERLPQKLIKLLADHCMWNCDKVLGLPSVIEDRQMPNRMWGLYFRSSVSSAPSAQDVAIKFAEGIIDQVSVGTRTRAYVIDDKEILHNTEMILYDISVVPYAANTEARISASRSLDDFIDRLKDLPDEALERVRSALLIETPKEEAELPAIASQQEVAELTDLLKSLQEA